MLSRLQKARHPFSRPAEKRDSICFEGNFAEFSIFYGDRRKYIEGNFADFTFFFTNIEANILREILKNFFMRLEEEANLLRNFGAILHFLQRQTWGILSERIKMEINNV